MTDDGRRLAVWLEASGVIPNYRIASQVLDGNVSDVVCPRVASITQLLFRYLAKESANDRTQNVKAMKYK